MKRMLMLAAAAAAALSAAPAMARPHGNHGDHGNHLGRHDNGRHRGWSRGDVLPAQYRSRSYVIRDYSRYRLAAPPRGYEYVRYGDDALLTSMGSGIIARVIADVLSGGYGDGYVDQGPAYYGSSVRSRSYVRQGPGGQVISQGGSYVEQGPGGQVIVTEGPNGRTITEQGPYGQRTRTVPYGW